MCRESERKRKMAKVKMHMNTRIFEMWKVPLFFKFTCIIYDRCTFRRCAYIRGMGHFKLCIVFSEAAPAKRGCPKKSLQDRYLTLSPELESDLIMVESHQEALVKEMKNTKPRSDIFIPLMKSIYLHGKASVYLN